MEAQLHNHTADFLSEDLRNRRTGDEHGTCDALDPCARCRAERRQAQQHRALARIPEQRRPE